jgi:hypothetical protein
MYLSFEKGLAKYYGLLELAVGFGVIQQSGSTYTKPNGDKIGQYGRWKDDLELWDNFIVPGIEEKIKVEWKYGQSNTKADDIPDEVQVDEEVK